MIHDLKRKKGRKIKLHIFFLFKKICLIIFLIFHWREWDESMGLPPLRLVVRHLLLYLVCFTLFGYFHTVSHHLCDFYFYILSPGGGLLLFSPFCFKRHRRGIGGEWAALYIVFRFLLPFFFSSIEMLEPSSSETCGTDEVIGGKKKTTGASRTEGGPGGSSGCVFSTSSAPKKPN